MLRYLYLLDNENIIFFSFMWIFNIELMLMKNTFKVRIGLDNQVVKLQNVKQAKELKYVGRELFNYPILLAGFWKTVVKMIEPQEFSTITAAPITEIVKLKK